MHSVVRMCTQWLGAQFSQSGTSNLIQIHPKLRLTLTSIQAQFNSQSFQIQITIISNSNHNHFKFKSDFKSHSLQIQVLLSWASKHSQFRINFISSLRWTQVNFVLQDLPRSGPVGWRMRSAFSGGHSSQIGVSIHLSNFMHVQIWYLRFNCRRWGSIFGFCKVSIFLLSWMLHCFKLPHSTIIPTSHKTSHDQTCINMQFDSRSTLHSGSDMH